MQLLIATATRGKIAKQEALSSKIYEMKIREHVL